MKVVTYLLGALITALVTVLITAALQGPINDYFRGDRVDAVFEISEWRPHPADEISERRPNRPETNLEMLPEFRQIERERQDQRRSFAVLHLRNNSNVVITNVRLRFVGTVVDILSGRRAPNMVPMIGVPELNIPEMRQGDARTYYVWFDAQLAPADIAARVQTFSSSGALRTEFRWPASQMIERTWFERFVQDWLITIIVVILAAAFILIAVMARGFQSAAKRLVADRKFYTSERKRFQDNPSRYVVSVRDRECTNGETAA